MNGIVASSPCVLGSAPLQSVPPFPVEPLVALAFALLVVGVVGGVTPAVPSGISSLLGVLAYWWATGEPALWLLSGLVLLAGLATVADWFASAVAAKAGGASTRTTVVATAAGLLGLLVAGPVGFLVVTTATVFGLELTKHEDVGRSARTAGVTLLGMLASSVFQLLVTASVLLVMVGVALF